MKDVTVTLKRLPTVEDYKLVGLTSGYHEGFRADGDAIINEIISQFDGEYIVQYDDKSCDVEYSGHKPIIWFDADNGQFYLPAELFNITFEPESES